LIEHDKKIAFCGQQFSKQHGELLFMTHLRHFDDEEV
jgi:hypothetical protein